MTYVALMLTTAIYAWILDTYKDRWEPDWTFVEVIIGTIFCLGAAALHTRLNPNADYEWSVWLAFLLGGFPIVVWRVGRIISSRNEALDYERTKTLAQKRRMGAPRNRGTRRGKPASVRQRPPRNQAQSAAVRTDAFRHDA